MRGCHVEIALLSRFRTRVSVALVSASSATDNFFSLTARLETFIHRRVTVLFSTHSYSQFCQISYSTCGEISILRPVRRQAQAKDDEVDLFLSKETQETIGSPRASGTPTGVSPPRFARTMLRFSGPERERE